MKRTNTFNAKHYSANIGAATIILAQKSYDEFTGLIVGVQGFTTLPPTTVYAQKTYKGLCVFVEHATLGFKMDVTANATGLKKALNEYYRRAFPLRIDSQNNN